MKLQVKMNLHQLLALLLGLLSLGNQLAEAYHHPQKHGHVKIKVWRGPSHGYKHHKYAPFGYHFSVDEKGH